jgi:iron complex outermembrane receptor protein
MKFSVLLNWAGLSLALAGFAQAQSVVQSVAIGSEEVKTLEAVTVTGNPLGNSEAIAPVASLSGEELILRTQTTLGRTLDGLPGVASTYFGPNASRPTVRGLDGDRVRVLNNSGATADVSALSYDHAVTLEPMLIERVEVLRGPGALLYGGGAVGGVVNVLDNRIAREAQFDAAGGVAGKTDLSWAQGNQEHSGAVMVESGTDRYNLHVDAMRRFTQDVSVPANLSCTRGGVTRVSRSLCNSASETWGGALGGSMLFDQGYLGVALSTFGTNYGTVAEANARIDMHSSKLSLEGEVRDLKDRGLLGGWLQSVKAQVNRSDYRHTEFDNNQPKTVFRSIGNEIRLQSRHQKTAGWEGVLGVQAEYNEFSAAGDEAFVPSTRTHTQALFVHEEYPLGWGHISAGARTEQATVVSLGSPSSSAFTVGSRSFAPQNYALGVMWQMAPAWQMTSNLSLSERAPKDYELFARGTHVATNLIEVGQSTLDKEKSTNFDLGLGWKRGAHKAHVQAFVHEFSNYISLEQTDATTSPATYTYTPVKARFTGLEASGNLRLLGLAQDDQSGLRSWAWGSLDLGWRADSVRAENTTTSSPLPRIAPMRLGADLKWIMGPWSTRLAVDQVAAQNNVPSGQLATPGYQMWNAALTYRTRQGRSSLFWFARLDNLTDVLAYSATSILTQTAAGRAPLPGRNVKLGVQIQF